MSGQIFNPNNAFFRPFGKLVDLVILSVMWTVSCLLVVTAGPASAALYRVSVTCLRRSESVTPARDYIHSFRMNLKVGALCMLVLLPIFYLVWVWHNLFYLLALETTSGIMLYIAFCILLILGTGIVAYIFPTLSRFEVGVRRLLGNCLRLAMVHLPSTMVLGVITLVSGWLCINIPPTLLVLPGLTAVIQSLFLEQIFRPYLNQEDEEDEEETE